VTFLVAQTLSASQSEYRVRKADNSPKQAMLAH